MKIPLLGNLEFTALRSKVARQMFLLFIVVTFVPLAILSYFAFVHTAKELREQATDRLHEACKTVGMSLVDRLQFLESDFDIIVAGLREDRSERSLVGTMEGLKPLKDRFVSVTAASGDGEPIQWGPFVITASLNEDEVEHIRNDKTLVLAEQEDHGTAAIILVKALDPSRPSQGIVYGRITPEVLWGKKEELALLGNLIVMDQTGRLLFLSDDALNPLVEITRRRNPGATKGSFVWFLNEEPFLASFWALFMKPQFHAQWHIVHTQPESEIFGPVSDVKTAFLLVTGLTFMMVLLLTINQIRKRLVPIETLINATRRVRDKEYGSEVTIRTNDEFEELGRAFNRMTDSIRNHFMVMDTINHLGITLSAEKNSHRIIIDILAGARRVTSADGYALFMVHDNNHLQLETMTIESLDRVFGSAVASPVPLYDSAGTPNTGNAVVYAALNKETVNISDIYQSDRFDFSENIRFDRVWNYQTRSLLCVPMVDHENRVIGILQLINARPKGAYDVSRFTEDDQMLIQALASQAGVALSKNRLIEDMKKLFDALVELISTAIDEKSPYTGGHSRRVADLTLMIANAVAREEKGPFKEVKFSEEDLYELKIAALLHDCGKVTTPVHIMDKATKLEGIFDRIKLIDARFEILKRDIQMSGTARSPGAVTVKGEDSLERQAHRIEQLRDDREFVRSCNSGERSIKEEDKQRMYAIKKKYRWTTMEGAEEPILTDDETYNLTVGKGTINPEERELINAHVDLTIRMLESLPYPVALRNVPVIVATHHERTDGSGYPKGLKGDQIPLQGRILAIADIFEALLAGDRPYKKGKKVSEALGILGVMKKEGQVDADLFDLFVRRRIYSQYASACALEEQIDEVDPSLVPGYCPPS